MKEWILSQDGITLYISLFALLMGGVIGLPIPEDIPLILAGILIQLEKVDIFLVFAVCYAAIVLGDVIIFGTGRYFGPAIFKMRWFQSRSAKTKVKRVRVGLERRSIIMIFVARHLFYIRTLTFLSCGALRMNFWRFLFADAIAALVSAPLMLAIGYFAADSYDLVVKLMNEAKTLSLIGFFGLLIVGWIYHKYSQRLEQPEE